MQSTRSAASQAKSLRFLSLLCAAILALAQSPRVPEFRLQVVNVYPHDESSFTQGLEFHDGLLYEGTGGRGHSRLRVEQLETGKVLREVPLDEEYFGEGITLLGAHIYQLTWLHGKGFLYDAPTFRKLGEFRYTGQGWGLTNDGRSLYESDGSAQIRVWEAESLSELRRFTVHDGPHQIDMLNELEWVRGEIWANVWHSNRIARIAPADGRVVGWIDATGLIKAGEVSDPEAVLNGIAYDAAQQRVFVTGKLWPKIFEVRLIERATAR